MENSIGFADLTAKYLAWCKCHQSPRTHEWYSGHLTNYLYHLGENAQMPAVDMKPFHVAEWIDSKPKWGPTYKGGAIVAVKRVYNWAEEMGYLEGNPIKKLKKPTAKRRENYMKPEDYEAILARLEHSDPFRALLMFVWSCGCRPQEVRHIEARHVSLEHGRVKFPAEESKGKRYPRRILLTGVALEIITELMDKYPDGKLFRNTRGDAWTKFAICNRMDRLSKATGRRMALYDARHGYATRKLKQGIGHLIIAAAMGHRDGSMLSRVYSHVDEDEEHLKAVLAD